jgi:hypothetical protein
MEELIKQAFEQVDVLGPHVRQGRYDLTGPNGEIILPGVWDKVVQPEWNITMTMWPMENKAPPPGMAGIHLSGMSSRRHGGPIPIPTAVPPPPGHRFPPGMVPPPPGWAGRRPNIPADVDIVDAGPPGERSKSSKHHKSRRDPLLGFFAGKPSKKK